MKTVKLKNNRRKKTVIANQIKLNGMGRKIKKKTLRKP